MLMEEARDFEKSALKVFDKAHNPTNESSEAEALELLSQLPNPAEVRDDEYTLLHHACWNGWYEVSKVLIEKYNCDPNCRNAAGSIPLRLACRSGNLDLVKYLILDKGCDPNDKNNLGLVPLHNAASGGHLHVTRFLIEQCNINSAIRDSRGWTPLHFACQGGYLNLTVYFIEKHACNPASKTKKNQTPLHSACLKGHVHVAKYLIEKHKCDPVCKNNDGQTPLHFACWGGHLNEAKYLVEEKQCYPSRNDKDGWTPLHLACQEGYQDVIKYLIEKCQCDPACKKRDGQTPLHSACLKGHINVAKYLIEKHKCDPACKRNDGQTPLHFACRRGHLNIAKYLIERQNISPTIQCVDGQTPLHSACTNGKLDVIKYLIKEQQCDPNCRSLNGMTPLHLACRNQHFGAAVYLVNECIGDALSSALCYGNSLMEETIKGSSDDILFFLMSHGLQFTSRFRNIDSHIRLVEPTLKVFVLGNANSGKSTLIKALGSKLAGDKIWFRRFGKVSGVEPYTAGIIPNKCQSRTSGTIMLYDFAGQHEHYSSSHAAILEKLKCAQNDLVFIVADISRPKETLVKELNYWDSFMSNQYRKDKPPVVVIGSHLDMAKQHGETTLSQALNELPHLNTYVTLDCTRKSSPGLTKICSQISTYSECHYERFSVSAQVHFLNRLLGKKFEDEIACQLYDVFDLIGHEDNAVLRRNDLLPPTMDALSNQVSKLSEHGQLVYIENSNDVRQSWIILRKEVLLSELNGSIFAPEHFESVYKDFSSTGVVALSKVKEAFPHYDQDMLMSFMNTLDFCHEIDKSDLSIIGGDQQILDEERYYFFPALVSTEKNRESCQGITKMSYKFGWCLRCKGNIFFSSRFLQVLLLRLAFTFALPDTSSKSEERSLDIKCRMCNIWKNGIHWQNSSGVETIVEVVEQNTAVVLVMGCFESSEVKCIRLRSAVIETILSVQEKYSSAVDAEESFLHPEELASYHLRSVESLFTFPLCTLRTAIKEREDALTNKIGRTSNMIPINTLLFFEPYTCLKEDVICKLMEGSDQNKPLEGSDDDFFNECAKVAHPKMALLKKILLLPEQDSEYNTAVKQRVDQYSDDPTHKCFHIFKTWQKFTPNPTYRGLREALDSYSIFRGRCPLP